MPSQHVTKSGMGYSASIRLWWSGQPLSFGHIVYLLKVKKCLVPVLTHWWRSWGYLQLCKAIQNHLCKHWVLWLQMWALNTPWPIKQCIGKKDNNCSVIWLFTILFVLDKRLHLHKKNSFQKSSAWSSMFSFHCPVEFVFTHLTVLHHKYCWQRMRAPSFQKSTPGYPWSSNP